jgi:outer membrane lipoprotein-sorting protein
MRRSLAALVPALVLAGCFGSETPAEHAADYARAIASEQGLTVQTVSCSPRGEVAWTCTGRLRSGRAFVCRVGPLGRSGATGTCTART